MDNFTNFTWDREQGAAQSPWAAEQERRRRRRKARTAVAGAGARVGFLGSRKLRALTIPK